MSMYFEYAGASKSETPMVYHRWAAISMISALLERRCYISFGHDLIYPNQYILLMGNPGTRKSSAINIAIRLLASTGYNRFSSDKTSKERFLQDLAKVDEEEDDVPISLDTVIDRPSDSYVAIGEFTDFIGQNNMEFITMLTNLWDCRDVYRHPKMRGSDVVINKPTVNILGGTTAQNFSLSFPPEAIGNGFLSRLILVHGDTTGRKVTIPAARDEALRRLMIDRLIAIRDTAQGEVTISKEAYALVDEIYNDQVDLEDNRFLHYNTRRLTHLLKLCTVFTAMNLETEISPHTVLIANTVLANTEVKMPRALGEFGKHKSSHLNNSVIDILATAKVPMTSTEIFKRMSQDVGRMSDLIELLKNLIQADRIQLLDIGGKSGYMTKYIAARKWKEHLLLPTYLTKEEMI